MTDVLAVAEHRRGELRPVSYQLLTAGAELAATVGGDLHVAVVGGQVDRFADALSRRGVSTIHTVSHGEEFNHDVYTQAVGAMVDELEPGYLLIPHSVNGMDFAPAVARDQDMTLLPDVVSLEVDGGTLSATREMYESKVETTLQVDTRPVCVTIRDGAWPDAEGVDDIEITEFEFTPDETAIGSTVTGYEAVPPGDVDITESDFLIGVGRGIGDADNLDLLEDLADLTGGTLAASRPVVDNGWLPKHRQVGQSGKTVSPEVYLALGISGAVQHVSGIRGADTVVAVNTDPNAPIFDVADYGIVGDLFDVVPPLIDELRDGSA
ncbi:MAG: electron transfer flavoprotein subunit alpha/FixB family protein [Halodesulfurarchaeum sp.]